MILNLSRKEMHQKFITQLLSPNASFKGDKILQNKGRVNASGLALCCKECWFFTIDVKVEIVLHRRILYPRGNLSVYYIVPFVFYTQ
jgi:hypothetical protein